MKQWTVLQSRTGMPVWRVVVRVDGDRVHCCDVVQPYPGSLKRRSPARYRIEAAAAIEAACEPLDPEDEEDGKIITEILSLFRCSTCSTMHRRMGGMCTPCIAASQESRR